MDDLEHQRELRKLRDEALGTPNCPGCLHPMEAVERDSEPVWACAACGVIA
ncbi:zf-TFIIB domain-containing protein [Microbacterium sp. OVT16B]|uniref:TFIIB-type zinc ribbon-containing protein n=1 Tax=Microbacterium sp. OVT16B TaxID=2862682 RepID=UPI001CC01F61